MKPVTYRITAATNVTVVRRDELTGKDAVVALNEDLLPTSELRVMQNPGTSNGTCTLVKREDGTNGPGRTIKPNHPFFTSVSALSAGLINQVASPYSHVGVSP